VAAMVLAKWLLVGRYRPGERPLWSTFVWRNELLNALHEHLAEPFLVGALTGTPFVCWYFRLLGARIGRRVYMETTDLSEFDLADIGDEAELNADCTIQTHLFEDRVMKMSTVRIAARGTVGAGSLVLYDTQMERGSALGDLSLLMKGEQLPAGTRWEGVPARPAWPEAAAPCP
jgi:non-ribosomal peptide synthetase-like protein